MLKIADAITLVLATAVFAQFRPLPSRAQTTSTTIAGAELDECRFVSDDDGRIFCSGNGCQADSTLDSSGSAYVACCPDDTGCAVPTSCRSQENAAVDISEFELDNVLICSGLSSACQTLIWPEFTAFAYQCGTSSQTITVDSPTQARGTTGLPSSSATATETEQTSLPTDDDEDSGYDYDDSDNDDDDLGSGDGSLYGLSKSQKIGIGVGTGCALCLFVAGTALVLRKRHIRRFANANMSQPPMTYAESAYQPQSEVRKPVTMRAATCPVMENKA